MTTPQDPSTRSHGDPAAKSGTFVLGGDLPVRRLGFGTMRLPGPGVWSEPSDRDQAIAVLRLAVELGINLLDTADSYGPGVAERLIAEALHPYPTDLVIATKAGFLRPGPDRWVEDGRPVHLRAACDDSLRRLRLERIDLYQLHRIDRKVPMEDQVGTLLDLQRQGKIRHIGLSEVSVAQLAAVRRLATVVSVQNKYNLIDRSAEDVLDYCNREGIGFIPWFPLATGNLARPGGPLARAAEQLHALPAQVAIAWLLLKSPVMLPIPGTSKVEHLEENTASALLQLDDAIVEDLERESTKR
jgi:pyridoxine 4-dehydrogenase